MLVGDAFEGSVFIIDPEEIAPPREQCLAGPFPACLAAEGDAVWHADRWAPAIIKSDLRGRLLDWGGKRDTLSPAGREEETRLYQSSGLMRYDIKAAPGSSFEDLALRRGPIVEVRWRYLVLPPQERPASQAAHVTSGNDASPKMSRSCPWWRSSGVSSGRRGARPDSQNVRNRPSESDLIVLVE